jgi:hypothetical protein
MFETETPGQPPAQPDEGTQEGGNGETGDGGQEGGGEGTA